ncbi:vitamin K epoxide reductase family protein [Candidatus Saccharibacteria bacterium]|nr:vitamin K epoxide reductase family protein [Candidatus Saccharibacteria bacterium]
MDFETAKIIIYVFSAIGILDTGYLIYHKLKRTDVACLFFPKAWCRKVQYSKQSTTFGIPNSFAGFAMYTTILALTYLASQGSVDFDWAKAVITVGFLFSMYFTFVQAFILRAFCTWCVVSAINFAIMFLTAWSV